MPNFSCFFYCYWKLVAAAMLDDIILGSNFFSLPNKNVLWFCREYVVNKQHGAYVNVHCATLMKYFKCIWGPSTVKS